MYGWLPDPEGELEQACKDVAAWLGGGAVWAAVTTAADGVPAAVVIGAMLAFVLRRTLRLLVAF